MNTLNPSVAFVGPHRRGQIMNAIKAGEKWKGTRGPVKMVLWLSKQAALDGERYRYEMKMRRPDQSWYQVKGKAGTLQEMLREIELLAYAEIEKIVDKISMENTLTQAAAGFREMLQIFVQDPIGGTIVVAGFVLIICAGDICEKVYAGKEPR